MQESGARGCRCYIAVAGGLLTPAYLGSRATFPGGKLGGIQASTRLQVYMQRLAVIYDISAHQENGVLI